MIKFIPVFMVLAAILGFSGCGSSSGGGDSSKVAVGAIEYYLPEGVETAASLEDGRGVVVESGDKQELSGFVAEENNATSTLAPKLLGAPSQANTYASSKIDSLISQIYYIYDVSKLTIYTKQNFTSGYNEATVVDMEVATYTPISSMDLISLILNQVGLSNKQIAGSSSALKSNTFRVIAAAAYVNGKNYFIVAAVPLDVYSNFSGKAALFVDSSNFAQQGATVKTDSDTFAVSGATATKADFLFVVDDSGSMANEQTAVQQAAEDFKNAIGNAGITDYKIAIITTGYGINTPTGSANTVLYTAGVIENNMTEFENYIVRGTSGSGLETGIYNAEYSLSSNGYLSSNFAFPDANTSLSVIILSDESSQYTYRSGGVKFNVSNNLFIDNGYIVHSIVSQGYSGQYEDLSAATGGVSANIEADSDGALDYSTIMQTIAAKAGGASSTYTLKHENVFVSKITVQVSGTEVLPGTTDGWTFNQSNNTISFYGAAIPEAGDTILVSYSYQE